MWRIIGPKRMHVSRKEEMWRKSPRNRTFKRSDPHGGKICYANVYKAAVEASLSFPFLPVSLYLIMRAHPSVWTKLLRRLPLGFSKFVQYSSGIHTSASLTEQTNSVRMRTCLLNARAVSLFCVLSFCRTKLIADQEKIKHFFRNDRIIFSNEARAKYELLKICRWDTIGVRSLPLT